MILSPAIIRHAAAAMVLLATCPLRAATLAAGDGPTDASGRAVRGPELRLNYLRGPEGWMRISLDERGNVLARETVADPPGPRPRSADFRAAGAPAPRRATATLPAAYEPPMSSWQFALYGSNIGGAGLVVADLEGDGLVEIVTAGSSGGGFGGDDIWYVLRETATADTYRQAWVSRVYQQGIVRLLVADANGDGVSEIYVGRGDGTVEIHDGSAPGASTAIATGLALETMEIADADGDGASELLLTDGVALSCRSLSPPYAQEWSLSGAGGTGIAVGRLDDDVAPEIVVTKDGGSGDGLVIDGATRAVQWTYINGFGNLVRCGDVDADGRDEIVAASRWYKITAFDAEIQTPKWEIPIDLDIGAMRLEHTDGDTVPEIIVGEGQWGSILCFDSATRAQRWAIANPEHGVTEVEIADVNGDGALEVLWGSGATSTGPDYLFVADLAERVIEWQSQHLDGPLTAVGTGDVDGDGAAEIAMISFASESGYDDGIIHLFDGATHELEWSGDSAPGTYDWMGVRALAVGNVDADPRDEIVYTSASIYNGKVVVFDGSSRTVKRASAGYNGNFFSAIALADVDGDGAVEVVAGQGREHTGATGVSIVVFDGATMGEEWKSTDLGVYWGYVSDLAVGCVDGDGRPEIVAVLPGGRLYVYDGVTHQLDWLAAMAAQSVEVADVDGDAVPEILLGRSGVIEAYDGATHALEASRTVGAGTILALTAAGRTEGAPWFFASDGSRLHHFAWGAQGDAWQSPVLGTSVAWNNHLPLGDADGDGGWELLAGSNYALYEYDLSVFPPQAPANVAASAGAHRDRIVVTWDDVADESEYRVFRAEVGGEFAQVGTVPAGAVSFADERLCASGPFRYHVRAANGSGISPPSAEATGETAACALRLTSPNGGELWRHGMVRQVTWVDGEGTGNTMSVELWRDGGIERILAAATENDDSFSWRIPPDVHPRTGYTIRLVPVEKPDAADAGDGTFEVAPPQITLLSPNGGELWRLGTTKNVRWASLGTAGNVRIRLYRRGVPVRGVTSSTADDGVFAWRIPATLAAGGGYTLRISAVADPAVSDFSNAAFRLMR